MAHAAEEAPQADTRTRKRPEGCRAQTPVHRNGGGVENYSSPLRKAMATACVLFAAPSFCMALEV